MKKINCLRCDVPMQHMGTECLQLGKTGWILGDLPNLMAGALEVELYGCLQCGKLEFFQPTTMYDSGHIAQKTCPKCGRIHDMDDPKCPLCKYNYYG